MYNEMADVIAKMGAQGDSTQCNWTPRPPRQQGTALSLESLVFWTDVLASPDPAEQTRMVKTKAGSTEIRIATANVNTLHPKSEEGGISARRATLAKEMAALSFN